LKTAGNLVDEASRRNAAAGADEIFVRLTLSRVGHIAKPVQNSNE